MKRQVYTRQQLKTLNTKEATVRAISESALTQSEDSRDESQLIQSPSDSTSNLSHRDLDSTESSELSRDVTLPNVSVLIERIPSVPRTENFTTGSHSEISNLQDTTPNELHIKSGNLKSEQCEVPTSVSHKTGAATVHDTSYADANTAIYHTSTVVNMDTYNSPTAITYTSLPATTHPSAVLDGKDIGSHYMEYTSMSSRSSFSPQPGYSSLTYTPLQSVGQLHPSGPPAIQPELPQPAPTSQEAAVLYNHHGIWEQENEHYANSYPWKYHDVYPASPGLAVNNTSNTNNNDSSIINHHRTVDKSYKTSRRAASGSKLSGGRRRRKRLQTPVQRSAANMRERRRMCHLNVAFDVLKERLPNVKDKKKLSRIQTLKAAIYYIQLLRDSLT